MPTAAPARPRSLRDRLRASILADHAERAWADRDFRGARRLFLAAALRGNDQVFRTLAQFLWDGVGGRRDEEGAIFWYGAAARRGDDAAANNLGCIWRDRGQPARALRWFRRAVQLGDGSANVNIAKIHINSGRPGRALDYLSRTLRSPWAVDASKEQAAKLRRQLRADAKRARRTVPGRRRRSRRLATAKRRAAAGSSGGKK